MFNYDLPQVPQAPAELENYVAANESKHKLKPDNEARIVWADSSKAKTPYAIVYLHGYSASHREGGPVHTKLAQQFGCNLYLARMADHGIDTTDAMMLFSPERYWNSAKEALAIGNAIGDKVIVMSCSTGSTVALMLAGQYPDLVDGLINLSPNIKLKDPAAFLLNDPWGLQIARMVLGGDYREVQRPEEEAKYWYVKYRVESLVQLEELLEETMNKETFEKIKQPSLTLYYYKSETEQDEQVRVDAMFKMNEQISTPDSLKVMTAIPNAGEHRIACDIISKDAATVYLETEKFFIEKMKASKVAYALNK